MDFLVLLQRVPSSANSYSLGHSAKATYAELSAGECLHIAATISIVQSIDAVHGISPINEFAGKYSILYIMVSMKCLIVNLYRPCVKNSHHSSLVKCHHFHLAHIT